MVGLHGAGSTSAVFSRPGVILVELRTVYGYDTDIFARVADSRNGTYVHIDIRAYSKVRRLHYADEALAKRIVNGIFAAQKHQTMPSPKSLIRIASAHDDYIVGPSIATGDLAGLMGPRASLLTTTCLTRLPYARYRDEVLEGEQMQYCSPC